MEDLVPRDHFLRRLEAALDFTFVYEEIRKLYSHRFGRPPIDSVVLVKYLLVGFLYGIPSEPQIEQRTQTDVALRWYLGIDLLDRVPDHSTISQLRRWTLPLRFSPDSPGKENTPAYKEALKQRQVWCEGTFAAQKWGHNLTRTLRRGIEAAEDHCLLSATALNLKRLIRCLR